MKKFFPSVVLFLLCAFAGIASADTRIPPFHPGVAPCWGNVDVYCRVHDPIPTINGWATTLLSGDLWEFKATPGEYELTCGDDVVKFVYHMLTTGDSFTGPHISVRSQWNMPFVEYVLHPQIVEGVEVLSVSAFSYEVVGDNLQWWNREKGVWQSDRTYYYDPRSGAGADTFRYISPSSIYRLDPHACTTWVQGVRFCAGDTSATVEPLGFRHFRIIGWAVQIFTAWPAPTMECTWNPGGPMWQEVNEVACRGPVAFLPLIFR